jgi:serine/threonine protein kinase
MSPELIQGMPTGYTSDTWSLGCIAYELAVLTPAFKGTSTNELMSKMTSLQYYPVLDEKSTIMSSELRTCIKWMLQQDPADRPTMQQLYLYIIQLDKKLRGDFELSAGDHTFSMDITCVP